MYQLILQEPNITYGYGLRISLLGALVEKYSLYALFVPLAKTNQMIFARDFTQLFVYRHERP